VSPIDIKATFPNGNAAQEAAHKLQALRAADIGGSSESGMLTATVDDAVADRAIHLIEQIGGEAEIQ